MNEKFNPSEAFNEKRFPWENPKPQCYIHPTIE